MCSHFLAEISFIRSSSAQKKGDGYSKIRFNGGERFTEIFDGGIFAKILDAKIEGNCI